ncbi:hypothetical protein K4K60_007281 [Colletotrichum sp. SAR11_57]|nr:hypothetical protein K4K60_007281 [Colletotrichum sp. SAR11_57]
MVTSHDGLPPKLYTENHLPESFYTANKPGRAIFSTNDGNIQPRYIAPSDFYSDRKLPLWSAEEIQKNANSIRKKFWEHMKDMAEPVYWEDMCDYFDCFDIYHHGALNIFNLLYHLWHENQDLKKEAYRVIALEIGIWCDRWLDRGNNKHRLLDFQNWGNINSLFSADDQVGNLDASQTEIMKNALHHRHDQLRHNFVPSPTNYPCNQLGVHGARIQDWLYDQPIADSHNGLHTPLTRSYPTPVGQNSLDSIPEHPKPPQGYRAPVVAIGTSSNNVVSQPPSQPLSRPQAAPASTQEEEPKGWERVTVYNDDNANNVELVEYPECSHSTAMKTQEDMQKEIAGPGQPLNAVEDTDPKPKPKSKSKKKKNKKKKAAVVPTTPPPTTFTINEDEDVITLTQNYRKEDTPSTLTEYLARGLRYIENYEPAEVTPVPTVEDHHPKQDAPPTDLPATTSPPATFTIDEDEDVITLTQNYKKEDAPKTLTEYLGRGMRSIDDCEPAVQAGHVLTVEDHHPKQDTPPTDRPATPPATTLMINEDEDIITLTQNYKKEDAPRTLTEYLARGLRSIENYEPAEVKRVATIDHHPKQDTTQSSMERLAEDLASIKITQPAQNNEPDAPDTQTELTGNSAKPVRKGFRAGAGGSLRLSKTRNKNVKNLSIVGQMEAAHGSNQPLNPAPLTNASRSTANDGNSNNASQGNVLTPATPLSARETMLKEKTPLGASLKESPFKETLSKETSPKENFPNPSSGATSRTVTPGGTPPKASGNATEALKDVSKHAGDVAKSSADEQKNDVAPVTSSSTANKNSEDHGGEQKKRTFGNKVTRAKSHPQQTDNKPGSGKNFSSSKKPKVQGENSSQAPSGPTSALPPTATWASKHRSGISGSKEDGEQK